MMQDEPVVAYRDADLRGATFDDVDLTRARFRNVDLTGASIRGALLVDVDLSGDIENLRVNGVDVVPLVEAELDRRHPGRATLRATDAAGFRAAWAVVQRDWPATVERARGLDPVLLHRRVDGEWSFVETLRHLVFATDAWVGRALLGDPWPFDPLGLPHTEMTDHPEVPNDPDARPGLDEVLAIRADRVAGVTRVIAALTDAELAGTTEPTPGPGYPEPDHYPVARCLRAVLNEEWEHRLFAERDLEALERTAGQA